MMYLKKHLFETNKCFYFCICGEQPQYISRILTLRLLEKQINRTIRTNKNNRFFAFPAIIRLTEIVYKIKLLIILLSILPEY